MSRAGSLVVVAGAQFAATDNELWVTGALPGVTGLASSATIITAVVPPGAGPGDLPVKKGGVSGNEGLSNAFPFAPAVAVS